MKYLKKFFENNVNFKENLLKFCNDNLSYLLDEGFEVSVSEFDDCYTIFIQLRKNPFYFYYKNIKNDFIPFFEFLRIKYSIIKPLSINSHDSSDIIMFSTEPTKYNKWKVEKLFYNEDRLLSGRLSNKRICNIQIFINKNI